MFSRRQFVGSASLVLSGAAVHARVWAAPRKNRLAVDCCVYGGTSGGVIAAVALARLGRSVALVEPSRHLGGMTSGGLGWVDVKYGGVRAYGGLTGEYLRRVRDYYARNGIDVNRFGNDGAVAEPHVAERTFEQMIAEHAANITVVRDSRLASVRKVERRIESITLDRAPVDDTGAPAPQASELSYLIVSARAFIDCSYEGDLMAKAGVSSRSDREGRSEYGESFAGVLPTPTREFNSPVSRVDPYVKPGDANSGLLTLVSAASLGATGSPSPAIQAFNFRLCLVKDNPIPIAPGSDYHPSQFELVARDLATLQAIGDPIRPEDMHRPQNPRLLKFSALPNGKTDVNNAGAVSMDFVTGHAEQYASASWERRSAIWRAHERYQRGFLYFLQTDPRVSPELRADLQQYGLPRDEFMDTHGWPFQLYVREVRRMVSPYVLKQSDCEHPPLTMPESVGVGTYSLDSHLCRRLVHGGTLVSEGGFMLRIKGAYPISYRALVPCESECENLLVTFCVSASHVSFASVRMEPPFMVLSESAAVAAHLAISANSAVQAISIDKLSRKLRDAGQIVLPGDIPI